MENLICVSTVNGKLTNWHFKLIQMSRYLDTAHSHLLLYVILVMVSLFSIRFRNEFDISAIWIKKEKMRKTQKEMIKLNFQRDMDNLSND